MRWIEGNGVAYFDLVKQKDLEGIVLKKKDAKYEINERSDKWLKVINYQYEDVLLTGLLKKDHSFLLSSLETGENIGIMEFVPNKERKKLYKDLSTVGVEEKENVILFKEGIKCNVKFRNWT